MASWALARSTPLLLLAALLLAQCGGRVTSNAIEASGGGSGASTTGGAAPTASGGATAQTCSQREPHGIFVSRASTASDADCGSRQAPCRTIQQGIARAAATQASTVVVASASYDESISLVGGVRIEGGWSQSSTGEWRPICDDDNTPFAQIHGVESKREAVLAKDLSKPAALAQLSVFTRSTPPPALAGHDGASIYGIFALGTSTELTLEDVTVSAGPAGDGGAGEAGADGEPAAAAGCISPADGANGQTPHNSDATSSGTFTADGYLPASGTPGADGLPGNNGTAPSVLPTCVSDCGRCDNAVEPSCSMIADSCGTPGLAGCGGPPGRGGRGGYGGGGAFALYVWGAQVRVRDGSLRAGDGGVGGPGGDRGHGVPGAAGVSGANPAAACTRCTISHDGGYSGQGIAHCSVELVGSGTAGGPGGPGGRGADGEHGFPGSRGVSCALFVGGGGTRQLLGAPVLAARVGECT